LTLYTFLELTGDEILMNGLVYPHYYYYQASLIYYGMWRQEKDFEDGVWTGGW